MQCWHWVEELMSINNVKLTLSWTAHVKELCKLTISWKAHINKPFYIDIELKNLCEWTMQRWQWVEKLVSMSNVNELS